MRLGRKPAQPKTQTEPKLVLPGTALGTFWVRVFLGVALAILCGLLGLAVLDNSREREVRQQQADLNSRILLEQVAQPIRLYREMLTGIALDPELVRLFTTADAAGLKAWERTLTALIPGALRVRLLAPGHDKAEPESTPPLSFASLALLRAAEVNDGPTPLELHQSKTAQAHLAAAIGVRDDDGNLVGLIHLATQPAPIRGPIQTLQPEQGRIELRQRVEDNNVTQYANAGEFREGDADILLSIPHSTLQLAHWYDKEANQDSRWLGNAAILLLSLLLGGLFMGWQYLSLRKALEMDKARLLRTLDETLAGHNPGRPELQLRDFNMLLELIMQRLKGPLPPRPATGVGASGTRQSPDSAATATDRGEPDARSPVFPEEAVGGLPEVIFRPHDIQGVVGKTLTAGIVRELGCAIGSQAHDLGQQTVIVARDARDSGPDLLKALIEGLNASGRDVIDLGMVPIPVLYFSVHHLGSDSGVMLTAGHNSPDCNGMKVILGGEALSGDGIHALGERVEQGNLLQGDGTSQTQDLVPDYIQRITEDVGLARPMKVVLDCGSGTASLVAPQLFRALGCQVVELYCEVDNSFPGHMPDPSRPENLKPLREAVTREQADLGLAFDADGGRLGVVDPEGGIVWPDRVLMLLAADVLSRNPGGDVIFDVRCSRALASHILQNGGRPVMWKSSHSLLKEKLRETGALLAGEWSGHIIFRERWYGFEDAMYAGARLLEILTVDPRGPAEVFAELPAYIGTPELFLDLEEGQQYQIMDQAQHKAKLLGNAKLTTIDGLRAELEDGWGLMRAANTRPALGFRFEADSEPALERIQGLYRKLLAEVAPNLHPPF